ncbi:hypothetical protein [Flavobacterium columnare]|uniref:Uncharacterized protein n=1 Tax=Flavobacterium columnare TaxID=996 RepID=A0AA94EYT0_9FLAO|nr:hypothetical protein [Flavobacterium columnare]MCH4828922.1 hypothetical protein [Flavobacterium columnare]MCH4831684.1 hypothetical protein [Flavobacterium columnare]
MNNSKKKPSEKLYVSILKNKDLEPLKFSPDININNIEVKINADDLQQMISEIKRLRHHEASTTGLWVIDIDPSKVNYNWILKNAFRIKKPDTCL